MTQELQDEYADALHAFRKAEDAWLRVEARRIELIWDRQVDLLTPEFLQGIKTRHREACRRAEELRRVADRTKGGAKADAEYACAKNGF